MNAVTQNSQVSVYSSIKLLDLCLASIDHLNVLGDHDESIVVGQERHES